MYVSLKTRVGVAHIQHKCSKCFHCLVVSLFLPRVQHKARAAAAATQNECRIVRGKGFCLCLTSDWVSKCMCVCLRGRLIFAIVNRGKVGKMRGRVMKILILHFGCANCVSACGGLDWRTHSLKTDLRGPLVHKIALLCSL